MKLWQHIESDVCPLCNEIEYIIHVLQYNSMHIDQKRILSIDALEDYLLNNFTPSNTINMIYNPLHSQLGNTHILPLNNSISLSAAVLAQNYIGWYKCMDGCLSIEWKIYASTFLTKKNRILNNGYLCWFSNYD